MRPLCTASRQLSLAKLFPPQLRSSLSISKPQVRSATYVLPDKTYPGDMGKDKVPYLLKTPKGTKDCTYTPCCSLRESYADHIKGTDGIW